MIFDGQYRKRAELFPEVGTYIRDVRFFRWNGGLQIVFALVNVSRPPNSEITFVKAMTVNDYLNVMLTNDADREEILKHLPKL
jgi:hypothetical protein